MLCSCGLERKHDSHFEDTFAFCGENCCSSKEFTRLQESEKQLENLEFQFLNIMITDSSEESSKTLQQLKLNTEHMQNNLCTVSNGLCCCLEPIRSLRKWLNKRCETLQAEYSFLAMKRMQVKKCSTFMLGYPTARSLLTKRSSLQ